MMGKREAIVLAGGFGTRLSHIVSDVPKPMAPVANRPFLRYILDVLADNGFTRVVIADGYKRECIEDYFGTSYRGLELVYSPEDEPLLTGGAVKKALTRCQGDWVYVFNGDTYLDVNFELFEACKADIASEATAAFISAKKMHGFDRYGTLDINNDGVIEAFNEKKPCTEGLINAGVYLLRADALEACPQVFSLETDYFEKVVPKGCLRAVVVDGDFIDIGVPEDYERAQTMLAPLAKRWKLAMFDRDGTINVDTGHLYEPDKLELIDSTVRIIAKYNATPDWKVVVVTNQAGIAKGMYTEEDMRSFNAYLNARLSEYGAHIDAYYYCPHHPDFTGECECRKPKPGMLNKAIFDFEADPAECVMYGDKDTDRAAAEAVGVGYLTVDAFSHSDDAKFLNGAETREVILGCSPDKVTYWVGAGVDYDSPRSLPLSADLVNYIGEAILGKERAGGFFKLWEACVGAVPEDRNFGLRMETFLGAVRLMEDQLNESWSPMQGLSFFDDAPANSNTRFLAGELLKGSDIVTTNYSLAIEREAERTCTDYSYVIQRDLEFGIYSQSVPSQERFGVVYHLHGLSSSVESMGITLKSISRRFPASFVDVLRNWFEDENRLVVFAGYSGSDEYDVGRTFELFSNDAYCKAKANGLMLRHSSNGNSETIKEKNLLMPFDGKAIGLGSLGCYAKDEIVVSSELDMPFDWRECFDSHAKMPQSPEDKNDLEILFTLVLSDYFGINLSSLVSLDIDLLHRLKKRLKKESAWFVNYYSIRFAEVSNNTQLLRELSGENDLNLGDRRTLYNLVNGHKNDVKLYSSINEMYELWLNGLDGDHPTWGNTGAPLNHWFFQILADLNESNGLTNFEEFLKLNECQISKMLYVAERASNREYDEYESFRIKAIALRTAGVLSSLKGNSEKGCEYCLEALSLYEDISSINGMIVSYILLALSAALSKNESYHGQAIDYQKTAIELYEKSGNHNCKKKIDLVSSLINNALSGIGDKRGHRVKA